MVVVHHRKRLTVDESNGEVGLSRIASFCRAIDDQPLLLGSGWFEIRNTTFIKSTIHFVKRGKNHTQITSHSSLLPIHPACHQYHNHTQYQRKQSLLSPFHSSLQHMQITVLPASFSSSFSLHRTNLHCFLLLVRASIILNSTMLTLDVDPLRYLSKTRDGMVYWQCCGRLSRRRQACAKQRRIVDGARFSS